MMTERIAGHEANEQLLGEIETEVVAVKRNHSKIQPGDRLFLELDAETGGNAKNLRVENGDSDLVGYLPRRLGNWLQSLVRAGKIRLEGYMPMESTPLPSPPLAKHRIVLTVFQSERADIFAAMEPTNEAEALHEMVRQAYCAAQRYHKPEMVIALARGLRGLNRLVLLPETQLLLAMLSSLIREIRACNGISSQVELSGLLKGLSLGEPIGLDRLKLFPLFWPKVQQLPYILLAAAVASGEAIIEETGALQESGRHTVVLNRATVPLLVPEGEVVCGELQTGVVAATVLLAPGASQVVALRSIEEWRSGRYGFLVRAAEDGRQAWSLAQDGRDVSWTPAVGTKENCHPPKRTSLSAEPSESDHLRVYYRIDSGKGVRFEPAMPGSDEPLRRYWGEFPLAGGAAGVVVENAGRIVGIDLFAGPETLQSLWGPLVDSYFRRAIHDAGPVDETSLSDARAFIDRIAGSAKPVKRSAAIGCEFEICGEDLAGRALVYAGQACHVSAFVRPDEKRRESS
jgi:hypothetical protein